MNPLCFPPSGFRGRPAIWPPSSALCLPAVLFLLSSAVCLAAFAQTTITNTTYTSGQNIIVSDTTIAAGPAVTVSSGAVVRLRATTSSGITLSPGFTAASGGRFRAFIFVDSDGDGMDNKWEKSGNH